MDADFDRRLKQIEDLTGRWLKSGFDIIQGGRLFLRKLPSDPATLPDGSVWHHDDHLHARIAGATENLAFESSSPVVIARAATATAQNTTNETTLISQSIAAGLMGTTRKLRYEGLGLYLNTTGAGDTVRLRVKFGGSTLLDDTTISIPQNAAARPLRLNVEASNYTAANQWMSAHLWIGTAAAATTGVGDLATVDPISAELGNGATIDTTAARTFEVTVTLGTADANIYFQVLSGTLELV